MKTASSIISGLKFILKYAALIAVVVKIVTYAIDELEKAGIKSDSSKPLEVAEIHEEDEQ